MGNPVKQGSIPETISFQKKNPETLSAPSYTEDCNPDQNEPKSPVLSHVHCQGLKGVIYHIFVKQQNNLDLVMHDGCSPLRNE